MRSAAAGTGPRDTYGAVLLLLSATAVAPGIGMVTAPFAGMASLLLGFQLTTGRPTPWLPVWLRTRLAASNLGPRFGRWIHARCRPLLLVALPRFPHVLAGLTVAWSSLILLLPLALIPFGNMVPALSVGMIGAGLLTGRSLFGWLGLALSGGVHADPHPTHRDADPRRPGGGPSLRLTPAATQAPSPRSLHASQTQHARGGILRPSGA